MNTSRIDAFGEDVFRNSTYIDKLDLAFSQFFVRTPTGSLLAIATGMRADFPQLKTNLQGAGFDIASVASLIVPHFESDEMGALPDFMAHNAALVAYAHPICAHALSDIFSVKTKILKDETPVTINGEVVVPIHAKHVHQWDSLVVYVPRLKALFSSDIFMSYGPVDGEGGTLDNIVGSIDKSGYIPSLEHLASALKKIRKYDIESIFPMHGAPIRTHIPETIDGLIEHCETHRAVVAS
ncbi:putative flavoprotein [Candidatus Burkholderia verschuerenii]|uniref:Putative flavoprotein n=1 Tax=Candidatus Burkholderia verschuerenii TaxID=242163 RepID=A0A0L0MAV8_9BURK|nr:MBL fold metallo-hydrolase [Candidatus Burkholderia verschuerenii]KND59498.1 putative flavoprotein [Candidatus Burkholderia verschuerenii]